MGRRYASRLGDARLLSCAGDLAYPERFAVQMAYLDAHPDVVAVGAAARHIDAEDRPTG